MLEVQKFLLKQAKVLSPDIVLESLKVMYGIDFKVYEKEGCVILTYNMIDVEKLKLKTHPYVMDCRGLILSYPDFQTIYCKPFTRFFNAGECPEYQKDFLFEEAIVSEKVDGSLLSFWYHPEMGWQMATRSCAFAEGNTSSTFSKTFKDAVLKALPKNINLDDLFLERRNLTWTFEFVSPETRVVKNYGNDYALYFLAAHYNDTGEEAINAKKWMKLNVAIHNQRYPENKFHCRYPETYALSSMEEIQKFMDTLDETDEGFVCYHPHSGKRLKVKNPSYLKVAAIRVNGCITQNHILDMIFSGELDEYLLYFPEDKIFCTPYVNAYEKFFEEVQSFYKKELANLPYETSSDKKAYAERIADNEFKHMYFRMKQGCTSKEAFSGFSSTTQKALIVNYRDKLNDMENEH